MYKLTKCPATNKLACWFSWLDHCTSIKEIKGSNPVQAWFFTGFLFKTAKKAMILFTSLIGDKTKTDLPADSTVSAFWASSVQC